MNDTRAWRRSWPATAQSFLPVLAPVALGVAGIALAVRLLDGVSTTTIWWSLGIGAAFALTALLVAWSRAMRHVRAQVDQVARAHPDATVFLVDDVDHALAHMTAAGRLTPPAPRRHVLIVGPDHVALHPLGRPGTVTRMSRESLAVRVDRVDLGPLLQHLTLRLSDGDAVVHVAVSPFPRVPATARTSYRALEAALGALGCEPSAMLTR